MEKYKNKEGEVGIIVSPGFGAGWSTFNREYQDFLAMDKTLVQMCLSNADEEQVEKYLETKIEGCYTDGWYNCIVVYLPEDTPFYIDEHDGSERLVTENRLCMTA